MNTEVFIIITSLFTGGAERQAIWLANNLSLKGYKVNLLVLKKGDELSHLLLDGVSLHRFQIYSVESKRWFKIVRILRLAILSIKKTRKLLKESEKNNQVVISFLYHSYLAGFFSVLFNKSTIKFICSIRSDRLGKRDSKKSLLRHFVFKKILFKVDTVVFNSTHGLMNFSEDYKIKKKSIFIPNGLFRIKKIYEDSISEKIIKFLNGSNYNFVVSARIDPLNNFENLIEGFKQLRVKNKEFKCIIFGRGKDFDKINKLINSLNLHKNVCLFGNIVNASSYFHFFDVLIHPAYHAGFSNSVTEAIQSEINVIVGNIGDTAKLFDQNQLILNTFTAEGIFNSLMSYIGMSQEQRRNIVESSIYNLNYLLDNDKSLETWISIIE